MKLLFLLWPEKPFSKAERRQVLLERCAPEILKHPINTLRINIDDDLSTVPSPAPKWYKGDALVATVSVDGDVELTDEIKKLINDCGFKVGAYQVDESIYKDYGDNEHYRKRDWPDGERSPTEQAVTLLTKPNKYQHAEWIQRWHGRMSPVSEEVQPRARYVRNVITKNLDKSPAFDGVVEEAWPTPEHITNPYLFYCAEGSSWRLIKNIIRLLSAVMHFHQLHKIRTVTMSEYFIKS